ncbi:MAG: dTDP-4-amino-4,6-dideoxygalactose transaminase [Desulfobacteraceae bacterium]|nr:MAG: dTDP-4-amino-4,6-dideoxygalactose transaminase [Desulfobacteraceae bacterium]
MIHFNKPFIIGKELYNIAQAVINGHLSGDGSYTRACCSYIEAALNCSKAFLTPSCTAALEMAAILSGIQPGDEIIMPSFTFVSTANAFVLRGGIPVFVDIHSRTLNINELLIEEAITPRTKAIVPVHYAGIPCEMDTILSIAQKRNLLVIEDAAQAFFSTYKGRYLGAMGAFGCLSFHETKNVICGEGGALIVNDSRFIERAEIVREKGTNRTSFFRGEIEKYTWVDIGSSYLPSEIVAAFLFAQLEEAQRIHQKRNMLFEQYLEGLRPLEIDGLVNLPSVNTHGVSNGHIFYLITESRERRDGLIKYLHQNGVQAVFHYVPLHSSPAGLKYGRPHGSMHNTDTASGRLVRLPLYYEMTSLDVERIVGLVRQFYEGIKSDRPHKAG